MPDPITDGSARATARTCNLAVVSGVVAREPRRRTLPSGSVVVEFDLTTEGPDRASRTAVPCVWIDPPVRASSVLDAGLEIVVVGSIRRRFFRVGGATTSRTEVVVGRAVPRRRAREVERLVDGARVTLGRADGSPGR